MPLEKLVQILIPPEEGISIRNHSARTVKLAENNLTATIYKVNTEILKLKYFSSHKLFL